jgi:IS605 OrfB family transposase
MSNTYIITRKIQVVPVGDKEEINRVYTYLREGIKAQNMAMNQYMSALYSTMMMDISKEDRKELNKLYARVSSSKLGSAYDKSIEFAKGLPMGGSIQQKVKQDFDNAMKKGLQYGKLSLPSYREDNPLLIHVDYVRLRSTNPHIDNGLYHNYESHQDFLDHLFKSDLELFIKFANKITFKVIVGQPHKSAEIRSVFKNIFEDYYHIKGSSIEFSGTKIILNMSIEIPKQQKELDENVVVGVDLGIAIPAVCALNTNDYVRKSIGSKDDFLRVRTQIQNQRRRLQSNLKMSNGGHGRKKKMKPMDKFTKYEKHWVQTYNHQISKQIIDFALKNNAKYINLEDLSSFNQKRLRDNFLLANWSYYQLQQYIKYKAEKYGIVVRFINPYHTSQNCSCCGHYEDGQRVKQSEFICKNPECKNFGIKINADFNAARNIAMSTDFIKNK